LSISVKKF